MANTFGGQSTEGNGNINNLEDILNDYEMKQKVVLDR
jgi:hypothetical protein